MSRGKYLSEQLNTVFGGGAVYKAAAFLILLLLMMGAYNANVSYAWFTDSHEEDFSLVSGKVNYEVKLEKADGKMIPGVNLIKDIEITNKSTIDTDFRIRVGYNYYDAESVAANTSKAAFYIRNASETAIYLDGKLTGWNGDAESKTQYMNITMDTSLFDLKEVDTEVWFEYKTTVPAITGSALDAGVDGLPVGSKIPVFGDQNFVFCYDGPKTSSIFEGRDILLTIQLQAKQAAHVKWEDLTIILPYTG